MLFVISLPNEYGTQVKERAHLSGKKVREVLYEMISSQFEKRVKNFDNNAERQDEMPELNLMLASLENEKNYRIATPWSREQLYER